MLMHGTWPRQNIGSRFRSATKINSKGARTKRAKDASLPCLDKNSAPLSSEGSRRSYFYFYNRLFYKYLYRSLNFFFNASHFSLCVGIWIAVISFSIRRKMRPGIQGRSIADASQVIGIAPDNETKAFYLIRNEIDPLRQNFQPGGVLLLRS